MTDLRSIRRRFYLLLALRFVPTGLTMTVFVLLMLDRGLSLAQIGLGTAAQGVVMLFLELPSGGLADALGRKPVLILATLFSIAAMSVLLVADTVLLLAVRRRTPGGVPGAGQRTARGVVHRRLAGGRSGRRHRARPVAAERGDLHLHRHRRACSAGRSRASDGVFGIDPLVAPIAARSGGAGRGAGGAAHADGRGPRRRRGGRRLGGRSPPCRRWSAARVRLIQASALLDRARGRRAPVGLRDDRVRGAPSAAAGRGHRWRRGRGGSPARPVDHRRRGCCPRWGRRARRGWCGGSARRWPDARLRLANGATVVAMGLAAGPDRPHRRLPRDVLGLHGATAPVHYGMVHRAVESSHRATVVSANSLTSQVGGALGGILLGALADATSITTAMLVAGGGPRRCRPPLPRRPLDAASPANVVASKGRVPAAPHPRVR